MASKNLIQALAVTAELTGTLLSEAAVRVMVKDLGAYPEDQVLGALTRCRKELKGRLTVGGVVSRLEDGRPGPEQAWAMLPVDERQSVVWTEEMASAWGIAAPLIEEGERIGARMAFLEAYRAAVQRARDAGTPARWTPSLGSDPQGREAALEQAVRAGRLKADHAVDLLPSGFHPSLVARLEIKAAE